jgi:gas vesicle protein
MSNGTGKFLGGFLVGSAIGTLIGLWVTPQSSKRAKRLLRKSVHALPEIAEELTANVQQQADRLTESAQKTVVEALERLQTAIAVGQEASQRLQQDLSVSLTDSEQNPRDNDNSL